MGLVTFYKSYLGEWIALTDDSFPEAWYSPDGKKFYALKRTGMGLGKLSILYPHDAIRWQAEINLKEDNPTMKIEGSLNEPIFRKQPMPDNCEFVSLPMTRVVQGLYELPGAQFLCWTAYEFHFEYSTSHIYVGTLDNMKQAQVLSADSVKIFTDMGVFNIARCSWEGYRMERVKEKTFHITENDEGLKVVFVVVDDGSRK